MLKALLFPLTISLLALLGTAAPVVDSQTLPHPFQTRPLDCSTFFGQGIQAADCAWVLEEIGRMPGTTIDRVTGDIVSTKGVFGRGVSDDRFRMPQRFAVGTCAIVVDLTDPYGTVASTWGFAAFGAHELVTNCALTAGTGGIDNRLGFDTLLLNPFDLNQATRDVWNRCGRIIDDFGHLTRQMQMTPCIPPDVDAAAASMRAGFGRSGSTETQ